MFEDDFLRGAHTLLGVVLTLLAFGAGVGAWQYDNPWLGATAATLAIAAVYVWRLR